MRILIVEDDQLLGSGLRTGLRQVGWSADWLQDADAAEHALMVEHFDVLVLDLGLPGRDGLSLLRDLRRDGNYLPVLILTARDAIEDRVAGLDAGADDYLLKPFVLDELCARVRALLRRSRGQVSTLLQAGDLVVDTIRREVRVNGRPICLSPKEYALLESLAGASGRVVSRDKLHTGTYGWYKDVDSNALEVHIHNLRQKLGGRRILTVRGVGYRLVSLDAR